MDAENGEVFFRVKAEDGMTDGDLHHSPLPGSHALWSSQSVCVASPVLTQYFIMFILLCCLEMAFIIIKSCYGVVCHCHKITGVSQNI